MKENRTTPRVTVEDLLSLKRAERPDAEFWHEFEREMRVKQLAAIVEPRPWWAPFIRIGSRMARYQLPVGATAILALTFLTVREYRLPEATDTQFISENMIAETPTEATLEKSMVVADHTVVETPVAHVMAETENRGAVSESASESAAPVAELQPESVYSPAAEAIAANLAAVRAKTPELARLIARVSGVDEIINPRAPREVEDPLARVKAPSTSRRASRLLASALPANYSSEQTSRGSFNRVDRSLTEDRVYDTISRIGVKADRLAISF